MADGIHPRTTAFRAFTVRLFRSEEASGRTKLPYQRGAVLPVRRLLRPLDGGGARTGERTAKEAWQRDTEVAASSPERR